MKRRQPIRFISIVVALALSSTVAIDANADFTYSLRFDKAVYLALAGETVTVDLYLREVVTGGGPSQITDTKGLTTANVKVTWDTGGSIVNADGDATYGIGFDANSTVRTPATNIILNQKSNAVPDAYGYQFSSTIRDVKLGTLVFTLPAGNSSTIIQFADAHVPVGAEILPDDFIIGRTQNQETEISIESPSMYGATAQISNPEPSTFLLSGMGILGAAMVCRFRHRRSKADFCHADEKV